MGRKSRAARAARREVADGEVGPRQPCPCGSGRRYKNCHGSASGAPPYISRTFEGLPGECDWVALREFVPAGHGRVRLRGDDTPVLAATVLPGLAPALKRNDGEVWFALQVAHQSGDASRDFAEALQRGLDAEPGESVVMPGLSGPGDRLQDLVDADAGFEVTVLDGFDFWFDGVDDPDGSLAASLEQLNEAADPTARLTNVDAAYWTSVGTKEHLRWVLPQDEETALTALARLHASGADGLVEGSRLVGSFRAHGLLVPVWDLPVGTGAEALEEPATAFAERLTEALADETPLEEAQRSARRGLMNRQITVH